MKIAMEKLLTLSEAADLLRISKSTLYKMSSAKAVPRVKLGGRLLFERAALAAWVAKHAEPAE